MKIKIINERKEKEREEQKEMEAALLGARFTMKLIEEIPLLVKGDIEEISFPQYGDWKEAKEWEKNVTTEVVKMFFPSHDGEILVGNDGNFGWDKIRFLSREESERISNHIRDVVGEKRRKEAAIVIYGQALFEHCRKDLK